MDSKGFEENSVNALGYNKGDAVCMCLSDPWDQISLHADSIENALWEMSIVNKFYVHILIGNLAHEGVSSTSVKEGWLGEFGQGTCNEYIVVIERVVLNPHIDQYVDFMW